MGSVVIPVALHFVVEERRGPGNEHQSGQRFNTGHVAQEADGLNVSVSNSSIRREGEVEAVEKGAFRIPLQLPPAFSLVHKIVGIGEHPNFDCVSNQSAGNAENDSQSVFDPQGGYDRRKPIKEFVVDNYAQGYYGDVDEYGGKHSVH